MTDTPQQGTPYFCSWSGGKDCCLAFELAKEAGALPSALFTVMDETGVRSHSHGMTLSSLQLQADALGVPLIVRHASWAGYEEAFGDGLAELKSMGIADGVFGDMRVAAHSEWVSTASGWSGCALRREWCHTSPCGRWEGTPSSPRSCATVSAL